MCEFKDCKVTPLYKVILEDDDEIQVCADCLDYEVEDFKERFGKGRIFRDYAKQIIPLVIQ